MYTFWEMYAFQEKYTFREMYAFREKYTFWEMFTLREIVWIPRNVQMLQV